MSRIASAFRPGHTALIGYVTVGYPSIETTIEAVTVLAKNGCDIVELGIPFSDPLADGVTIQKASFQSLQNGVTPAVCLETARELRRRVELPLIFMTYYNPLVQYGLPEFSAACAASGIDGLIVPDLPPEEGGALESAAIPRHLDVIYLLAPTSTEVRIKQVAARSHGFIYLVSVAGVTGVRKGLSSDLPAFVSRVKQQTTLPLCVGFGISTPEQAAQVGKLADGVIVGSKLLQLMEPGGDLAQSLGSFVRGLRGAMDRH